MKSASLGPPLRAPAERRAAEYAGCPYVLSLGSDYSCTIKNPPREVGLAFAEQTCFVDDRVRICPWYAPRQRP